MALPLDAYQLSPTEYELSQQATWSLTDSCMVNLGFKDFDFKPAPVAGDLESHEDLRYGTYSVAEAGKYGYRPAYTAASGSRSGAVGGQEPEFTPEEEAALDGVSPERTDGAPKAANKTAKGGAIPKDGCYGQALSEVTEGRSSIYLNDTTIEDLDGQSYEKSLTDPKVAEVFSSWASCMKGKGYSYASPIDANNDPKWSEGKPSDAEIKAATADAQCKEEAKVLTVWHGVEVDIQKSLIATHSSDLTPVREMKLATVRNSK